MDFSNGLLGLGGIKGLSSQPKTTGLLGQYYDPEEMRRMQMKQGLLGAGIALLSGENLGGALAGGLQGAKGAQSDYMEQAKMAYDMDRQARNDTWENTVRERQLKKFNKEDERDEALANFAMALPEDQRALAEAYPDVFGEMMAKKALGGTAPTSYETVTTADGVFRVPNNNADPKAMVKIGERPERNEGEGREFAQEAKLRETYIKQAKPFEDLRINYQRIQAANQDNTGASDIAMVYSFMKMLDPTSVVREGEFATAQNAGGIPDQIKSLYNRAISGERLSPEVRNDFMQQAARQYEQQFGSYQQIQGTFRALAEQYGINPDRVAPDLSYGIQPQPQGSPLNNDPLGLR